MSYEIKGKVINIGEVQDISDKFRKREFVIETSEENNGRTFTEKIKFQLVQDKCGLIDKARVGEEVNIGFNIKGREWEKNGIVSYFNNLDAWKVDLVTDSSQPVPAVQDSEPDFFSENESSVSAPAPEEEVDDLPF